MKKIESLYWFLIFGFGIILYVVLLSNSTFEEVKVDCRDGQGNIMDVDYDCYHEELIFNNSIDKVLSYILMIISVSGIMIGFVIGLFILGFGD